MPSAAQVRRVFLALPEAEEKSHFGQPDFRVRNKIFGGLDRDEKRGYLKLTAKDQARLLATRAQIFSPASGAWGRQGWTHFDVETIGLAELEALAWSAWSLIAPKQLQEASKRPTTNRSRAKAAAPAKKRPRAAK